MAGAAWDLKRSGCTSTDPGGTQGPLGSEVREGRGGELASSWQTQLPRKVSCLLCLRFPISKRGALAYFLSETVPLDGQPVGQPCLTYNFRPRELAYPRPDKGGLVPRLFHGNSPPNSLAPAEQNHMPARGRRG